LARLTVPTTVKIVLRGSVSLRKAINSAAVVGVVEGVADGVGVGVGVGVAVGVVPGDVVGLDEGVGLGLVSSALVGLSQPPRFKTRPKQHSTAKMAIISGNFFMENSL
jgi:hypothetical protein